MKVRMEPHIRKPNHRDERKPTTPSVINILASKHVPALYMAISTLVLFHDQAVKLYSIVRVIVVEEW